MNISGYLFDFPVAWNGLISWTPYILVFTWCRWEFVPYTEISWDQTLSFDCRDNTLMISGIWGNKVDLSCLIPSCFPVPITIEAGEGGNYLVLNSWTACETSLFLWNFGGWGISKSYELLINVDDSEVAGKQYESFANANLFLDTKVPAEDNLWNIGVSGVISENIVKKDYVGIYGEGRTNTLLTGLMTLESGTNFVPFNIMLNGLYHLSLMNLLMTDVVWQAVPTTYEINDTQSYSPYRVEYSFSVKSTSGTYNIQVNGVSTTPLAFNATAGDIQAAIIALDPVAYADVLVQWTYTTGFEILQYGAPANAWYGPITLGNIDLDPFIAIWFTPYAGMPQQQQIIFSCKPSSGNWMLSLIYNGNTYNSYVLSYTSDAAYIGAGLRDILVRINAVEWIDLGMNELTVTGDYNTWFTISFEWYPGVASDVFFMVNSIFWQPSLFTWTVALAGGGISTPFTVIANNTGFNPIQISGFTGDPGDTIDSRISARNVANPTNTIMLVGDGTQIPAFKQYIKLSGWADDYNYNLECWDSLGQMMYLEDCDVGQIDYLWTKWMLIARNCTLYGGSIAWCDWECNLHTCIINGISLPNAVATYDTIIAGSKNMYWGDFYGGVIDLDQCTLNTVGLDGWPVVYRFYGTTIKWVYNGDATIELYNTLWGTFNMMGWSILTMGCTQVVINVAGGWYRQNYSDIYDNRTSWLFSTEYQAVIDEIVSRMSPIPWSGTPVWNITPRFVGDRYMDVSGVPTVIFYTSTGMNDTDRVIW